MRPRRRHSPIHAVAYAAALGMLASATTAQSPFGGPDTRSPRERALIDITGQWVAVVDEDWLWRMVTPPVGDTASVPLNAAGRAVALAWDRDRDVEEDNECRAFGPPGLIRQPTRLRVSWEGDDTLKLDFDAGRQTRRLQFEPSVPPRGSSLQGYSVASWYRQSLSRGVFGAGAAGAGGSIHVRTTNMAAGYLRPNGVPYSENATIREFFNTFTLPGDGGAWLVVTTVVNDPKYLTTEFVISTQFRKESGRAGWNPRPCEIPPPVIDETLYTPGIFG